MDYALLWDLAALLAAGGMLLICLGVLSALLYWKYKNWMHTVWLLVKAVTFAVCHAVSIGFIVVMGGGVIATIVGFATGVWFIFIAFGGLAVVAACSITAVAFFEDLSAGLREAGQTGHVVYPAHLWPEVLGGDAFWKSSRKSNQYYPHDVLPSGYSRDAYHEAGFSDLDIEGFGLDQPGAPAPDEAGFVISEMMEEGWFE